jgi:hypothetical protein
MIATFVSVGLKAVVLCERVPVTLINGVNHMGVVSDPAAVSAIADDMVKGGSGS